MFIYHKNSTVWSVLLRTLKIKLKIKLLLIKKKLHLLKALTFVHTKIAVVKLIIVSGKITRLLEKFQRKKLQCPTFRDWQSSCDATKQTGNALVWPACSRERFDLNMRENLYNQSAHVVEIYLIGWTAILFELFAVCIVNWKLIKA